MIKKLLSGMIILASAAILFTDCSNDEPKKLKTKKGVKLKYALNPDSIYRQGSITKALAVATPAQKNESRKLFMNGLDLLVNKNNAKASVEFFKEAIYYYPDEKSYSHLFDAYLRNNELALADSTNASLVGRIEYSETSFNSALISAAKQDEGMVISNLESAIMEGFAFKDRVVNEKLFEFMKDNQSFQSLLISNFGDDKLIRMKLYTAFLKSFPDLELPFEVTNDSVRSFNYDKYINYDFAMFVPGMENGRFSRDVSNEYIYVGKFKTERGMALVYKSMEMMGDTLNPIATNVVIYDSVGTIVSNETIACYCSPLESKACMINKDHSIDVKVYTTKWEMDPLEKGYAGNKIVGVEEKEKLKFVVNKENKLEEVSKKEAVASSQ
ncbi:MAG: hypothetical protein K0S32_2921 [Bacteroidetes bacterium]|jgi:hypothetical protein|nr:hypothetical protein [Bacteroidota bacterium]